MVMSDEVMEKKSSLYIDVFTEIGSNLQGEERTTIYFPILELTLSLCHVGWIFFGSQDTSTDNSVKVSNVC